MSIMLFYFVICILLGSGKTTDHPFTTEQTTQPLQASTALQESTTEGCTISELKPVENLTLIFHNGSITAKWNQPNGTYCGRDIEYNVTLSIKNESYVQTKNVSKETKYTFTNASYCQVYEVNVTAIVSYQNQTEESETTGQTITTNATSPETVCNLSTNFQEGNISVNWIKPIGPCSNQITHYNVTLSIKNESYVQTKIVSKETNYTFTNASYCQVYEVNVTAIVSYQNQTEESETTGQTITTNATSPETVRNLSTNFQEGNISVNWIKPTGPCSNQITHYNVTLSIKNEFYVQTKIVSKETNYTFTNASYCQVYEVNVTAIVSYQNQTEESETTGQTITTNATSPETVRNLSTNFQEGNISVNWIKPTGPCSNQITHYNVILIIKNESYVQTKVVSKETNYTFTNAAYCQVYEVHVKAIVSYKGQTEESETTVQTITTNATSPEAVRNLSTNFQEGNISVNWIKPTGCCSGQISEYHLSLSIKNESYVQTKIVSKETNYTFTNASYCQVYEVHVTAIVSYQGHTKESNTTVQTITTNATSPEAVRNLSTNFQEGNIFVNWTKPTGPCSGQISEYHLSLSIKNESYVQTKIVSKETKYTFTSASYCQVYEVHVTAIVSYYGHTKESNTTVQTITTNATSPTNPVLTITERYSNGFAVSWQAKIAESCTISNSTIVAKPTNNSVTEIKEFNSNGDISNLNLTSLHPYTSYNICMKAYSDDQVSEENCQSNATLAGDPQQPQNVSVQDQCHFSNCLVEWKMPSKQNGPTTFRVDCFGVSEDVENKTEHVKDECPVKPVFQYTKFLEDEPTTFSEITSMSASMEVSSEFHVTLYSESSDYLTCSHSMTNLEPFRNYTCAVIAIINDKENISKTIGTATKPSKPGPPKELQVTCTSKSASISWQEPNKTGEIETYILKFNGTRIGTDYNHSNETYPQASGELVDLLPEFNYTFQMAAKNKDVSDLSKFTEEIRCETPASAPIPPVDSLIPVKANEHKAVTFQLQSDYFSDENGAIQNYTIILYQRGNNVMNDNEKVPDHSVLSTWRNVFNDEVVPPYRITLDGWNPFLNHSSQMESKCCSSGNASVVICTLGCEENCLDKPADYPCNGPLKADSEYMLVVRAFTRGGYADSKPLSFSTNPDEATLNSIIIVIVTASVIVLFLIVVVIIHLVRSDARCMPHSVLTSKVENTRSDSNKMRSLKKISSRKASVFDGEKASGSQRSDEAEPSQNSRSIKLIDFPKHVEAMMRNSGFPFTEEYELLVSLSAEETVREAERPQNRDKNRYANILPFDSTRVKLSIIRQDPSTDYINANYIAGFRHTKEFIAAQGPLARTRDDFWRMVWETTSPMIVMVTQCKEKKKVKCDEYWPSDREFHSYGEINIRMMSIAKSSEHILRVFQLQKGTRDIEVKQMHFTRWPDFGCPETTQVLVNFVRAVRNELSEEISGPIIVHCSAGVGRTGTFIAVDILLQQMRYQSEIDIFNLVLEMRKHRPNMVQTEEQYIYIHECVRDVLIEKKSREVTENHEDENSDDRI